MLEPGGARIGLSSEHYVSDESDVIVYVPHARFLMAIDTLAPRYAPFMGFDITSNFHEYPHVFDTPLEYEFDVFLGGHLTHPGNRADLELTRELTLGVYETVKRSDGETAEQIGGWGNRYLLFARFLDVVTERATAEFEQR